METKCTRKPPLSSFSRKRLRLLQLRLERGNFRLGDERLELLRLRVAKPSFGWPRSCSKSDRPRSAWRMPVSRRSTFGAFTCLLLMFSNKGGAAHGPGRRPPGCRGICEPCSRSSRTTWRAPWRSKPGRGSGRPSTPAQTHRRPVLAGRVGFGPVFDGAHVRAHIAWGEGDGQKEDAGEVFSSGLIRFQQLGRIAVIARHRDAPLGGRVGEDFGVGCTAKPDIEHVRRVDPALSRRIAGRFADVFIEEEAEPHQRGWLSRYRPTRSISSIQSPISSGNCSR